MADQRYDAVCIGILVADVLFSPNFRLPDPGEVLLVNDIVLETGGCPANTSVTLAKLGFKVAVVGKVGQGYFSDFVVRTLTA
jgi:sugar/nucleoside kinase (ribokinase family)